MVLLFARSVSIMGLTIDYGTQLPWLMGCPDLTLCAGPYAFMDVFDPWHICNHSDGEGRYAYKVSCLRNHMHHIC